MHPILFQLGPLTVRTYGALIAVAFLASLRLAVWAARRRGISPDFILGTNMFDLRHLGLAPVLVLSGLLGARVLYVLLDGAYFIQHPWEVFKVWEGGMVFYGGFLAAAAAGFYYVRHHRVSVGVVADCLAPAIALGQAIGRWGCFFAG